MEAQVLQTYGIQVRQVGIETLSLPDASLTATVARMRSERETVAAERTAEGLRAAAEVRSNAERDGRITVAQARTEAAEIEAQARREAAEIQTRAYLSDPSLYSLLRSLDTLVQTVGPGTRLVLRTDSAPFSVLVEPPAAAASPAPAAPLAAAMTPNARPAGPVAQSLQISFRVLLFGVLLLAGGWCFSNLRQVPPDAQAAVLRFGRVVRVQPAGLLLAWPRPIERVELLPAPARQMELKVVGPPGRRPSRRSAAARPRCRPPAPAAT